MLKISKKIIAPFLSYSIFRRGLFFYATPCIYTVKSWITCLIHLKQHSFNTNRANITADSSNKLVFFGVVAMLTMFQQHQHFSSVLECL